MSMQNPLESRPPLDPAELERLRAAAGARVGTTLSQRYTLEQVLGVGTTGAVHRGSHRNGNRVAVKVVHPHRATTGEARAALVAAANEANRVDHPGAARILDDDTTEDGTLYVVMELVEGQTLAQVIARAGGRLAPQDVVPVVLQLLDVLAAAHAKGIVHRAVTPAKMLVAANRSLHLLGFGTSVPVPGAGAPEQARGEPATTRSDVWAVGAVLFQALTGRAVDLAVAPPPVLSLQPQLDPALASVIDRALAGRPDDRFPDAAAMAAALKQTGQVVITSVAPPPQGTYPPPQGTYPPPPAPFLSNAPPPLFTGPPVPPGFVMPSPPDTGWVKWVVGGVVLVMMLVVLTGGAVALALRSTAKKAKVTEASAAWSDADSPVPVSSLDPMWGQREAPITIVVFSDFQCPFCKRAETTIEQVKSAYGPEQVRVVWKNDPLGFHKDARPAARAAQAVFVLKGSAAFFRFHDLAFEHQTELAQPEQLRAWAVQAGVDGLAYDKLLAAPAALEAKIDADLEVAKTAGATGTPSFRINGLELSGAQPLAKFKDLIDAELPKAKLAIANGAAKSRIYVERSKVNFTVKAKKEEAEPDTTTVWRVPVEGSPVRGNVDAPVTVVEIGDFQCPFCKRAETTVDKIRDTYGERVRIVWKHNPLPFHQRAEPAAQLALEARAEKGDAGFWRAHDALFDSQPRLDDADLLAVGAKLGLDAGKSRLAIRDHKYKKDIDRDVGMLDGLGDGNKGTPTFYINGRELTGAQPFDKFQPIIDEELAKFDGQSNVKAKDWYATIMRDAKGAAEPEKKIAPPVAKGIPFRGGANAKVVIQEWADHQCPFCARAEPTLDQLLKHYGDRIQIVWRDKPLAMHPDAALAAEAAREVFAQKGVATWVTTHKLFLNDQKHLGRSDLDAFALRAGCDMKRFDAALDAHKHKDAVDADDKLGTDLGISGTPSFLINDYYLSGAQPYAKFEKLVERALDEAK